MAYEAADDHDCPHCPPAEMQGHHSMHGSMDVEMPCADVMSDCSLDGEFSHDTRTGQSKAKDSQGELSTAIVGTQPASQISAPARVRSPPPFATAHAGAPPSLHVLYCVYLD
jgi:hypothetical protein